MSGLLDYRGDDCDVIYKNLRDGKLTYELGLQKNLQKLWQIYQPYAEKGFIREFRKNPDQRYWEMYLCCSLLNKGIQLEKKERKGPDFSFVLNDGRKIWIEAVCPKMGEATNADFVPEPEMGIAQRPPKEQIIDRYLRVIEDKKRTFDHYINKKNIASEDIKIIAISSGAIRGWPKSGVYPYILSALYPLGDPYVMLSKSGDVLGSGMNYQDFVKLKAAANRKSAIFLLPENSSISAVLYSSSDIGNPPAKLGGDIITIHNHLTHNPLPKNFVKFSSEYIVEEDGQYLKMLCQ